MDDEYSLHHKFSNATTKEDIESVQSTKKYAASHQDQFDIGLKKNFTNIATGEMLENFKMEYLLNSVEQGEMLYKQFVETWLIEHSKPLSDTLTKRNKKELASSSNKPVDFEKENVKALEYIDIVRTRNFDVEELVTYELSKQPQYLTKEKASDRTSQLKEAIEEHLGEPTIKEVLMNEVRSCILFDFMAYASMVPVKTDYVQCFGYFAEYIWNTFSRLSDNSKRIDIVFDLYIKEMKEYIVRNLYNQLLQPCTIKTKNFLSQWKVFGFPLETRNATTVVFYKMDL